MRHERVLAASSEPWTVVLLTCRDRRTDFRLPLARELAGLGHDVHYVHLKRRPEVTALARSDQASTMSLVELSSYLRRLTRAGTKTLTFNSTNLAFPGFSRWLRLVTRGLWCLDLHDDLLYDSAGLKRVRARLAQAIVARGADLFVHAAPTLMELFPRSHHLGNASDMTRLEHPAFNAREVLILASLDQRLDFEFLAEAAAICPSVEFHIHGQIAGNDLTIAEQLRRVTAANNMTYHGAYTNEDLPRILERFSVTLAPYRVGSRLTRYIDPLRYYHCLNAGLEVITTDIPAARFLQPHLHLVDSAKDFAGALERLAQDPGMRRNDGSTAELFNWRVKAERLMSIVASLERDKVAGHG